MGHPSRDTKLKVNALVGLYCLHCDCHEYLEISRFLVDYVQEPKTCLLDITYKLSLE